jgi:hypothetical protein
VADTLTGYLFCVFSSESREGPDRPSREVLLRSRADARFLEGELANPLAQHCGQSITTSDDAVFFGTDLPILEQLARNLRDAVEAKPPSWPVLLGYKYEPGSQVGDPIFADANRESILEFLSATIELLAQAIPARRYLHWAGGE